MQASPSEGIWVRRLGIVALFLVTVTGACAAASAPTPIVIYVTPAPTASGAASQSSAPTSLITVVPSVASEPAPPSAASEAPTPTAIVATASAPAPTQTAEPSCVPETSTAVSRTWKLQASRAGDFGFRRPADWVDRHGLGALTYGEVLDAQTLTDSGLDATRSQSPDIVGAPGSGAGVPNIRVFTIAGVSVPIEIVRSRLALFYANAAGNILEHTDLTACIDGAAGLGFDLNFGAGASYYRVMLAAQGDNLYIVEWVATSKARGTDIVDEVLRTWRWVDLSAAASAQPSAGAVSPPATSSPARPPASSATLKPGQTPKPTPINIAAYLTAEISVINYGDVPVTVEVSYVDESSGDVTSVSTDTYQPLDAASQKVPAGTFRLTFGRPGSSDKPAICNILVKDGDVYGIGITDDAVAIGSNRASPTTRADLVVPTSPLCKK